MDDTDKDGEIEITSREIFDFTAVDPYRYYITQSPLSPLCQTLDISHNKVSFISY